jgi:hypothetical protein
VAFAHLPCVGSPSHSGFAPMPLEERPRTC